MKRRKRLALALGCVLIVLGAIALLWFKTGGGSGPKSTAWSIQPDQFPIGTVLQGSRVEMDLGLFSGRKPAPLPSFISQLPLPLRRASESVADAVRTAMTRLGLRVRVEAPPFVTVTQKSIQVHVSQGPFAVISLRLKTDQPGQWHGNLVVRLSGSAFGATNIVVPLSVNVAASGLQRWSVLIASSPYQEYATGNGSDFEPLGALNRRLAERGVRVDYCRNLAQPFSGYRTILLADSQMAGLAPPQAQQLKSFVTGGGRLILAANAFFVPTVPTANTLLESYGLQIVNQDAGMAVTNAGVVPDVLTSEVVHVDFFRPSIISVTDPAQGKILVQAEDSEGGYVAVSRQPSRGEVIVVTQSLWWSWIASDPTAADNSLLLENLLAR